MCATCIKNGQAEECCSKQASSRVYSKAPLFLTAWLFLLACLVSVQVSHAALSPEAQAHREENRVLESEVLKGKVVYSVRMEELDTARLYIVEADCTYRFLVEYKKNWLGLFGWVGPQKFNVELAGEPDCDPVAHLSVDKALFRQIIFSSVSRIYSLPLETIQESTRLYKKPADPVRLSMDFRILALRGYLEERVGCRITDRKFKKLRTVGGLLKVTEADCNQK